jgi:hypothetical protein
MAWQAVISHDMLESYAADAVRSVDGSIIQLADG